MNPLLLPVSLLSYLPFNTSAKLNGLWLLPNGARKALATRLVWLERDWLIALAIFFTIFYSVNTPIAIIFKVIYAKASALKIGVQLSTGSHLNRGVLTQGLKCTVSLNRAVLLLGLQNSHLPFETWPSQLTCLVLLLSSPGAVVLMSSSLSLKYPLPG